MSFHPLSGVCQGEEACRPRPGWWARPYWEACGSLELEEPESARPDGCPVWKRYKRPISVASIIPIRTAEQRSGQSAEGPGLRRSASAYPPVMAIDHNGGCIRPRSQPTPRATMVAV